MIRKAVIDDIKAIHALLQFYNVKGELLARPLSKLYDHLRDFWVYEDPETKKSPDRFKMIDLGISLFYPSDSASLIPSTNIRLIIRQVF